MPLCNHCNQDHPFTSPCPAPRSSSPPSASPLRGALSLLGVDDEDLDDAQSAVSLVSADPRLAPSIARSTARLGKLKDVGRLVVGLNRAKPAALVRELALGLRSIPVVLHHYSDDSSKMEQLVILLHLTQMRRLFGEPDPDWDDDLDDIADVATHVYAVARAVPALLFVQQGDLDRLLRRHAVSLADFDKLTAVGVTFMAKLASLGLLLNATLERGVPVIDPSSGGILSQAKAAARAAQRVAKTGQKAKDALERIGVDLPDMGVVDQVASVASDVGNVAAPVVDVVGGAVADVLPGVGVVTSSVALYRSGSNLAKLQTIGDRWELVFKKKKAQIVIPTMDEAKNDRGRMLSRLTYKIRSKIGEVKVKDYLEIGGNVLKLGFALAGVAGGAGVLATVAGVGGANAWNPVGWTLLGVSALGGLGVAGHSLYRRSHKRNKLQKYREQQSRDVFGRPIPVFVETLYDWYSWQLAVLVYTSSLEVLTGRTFAFLDTTRREVGRGWAMVLSTLEEDATSASGAIQPYKRAVQFGIADVMILLRGGK